MMVNQGVKVSTENRKGAQRGERMRGLRENFALLFFLTVLTRTGETAQKHAFFRHKKTPIKGVCKFKWWCIWVNLTNKSKNGKYMSLKH